MLSTQESQAGPVLLSGWPTLSSPYFCLRKMARASVTTSVTGSPCCTHGRKLVLKADAMSDSWPLSIAVVSTLPLPASTTHNHDIEQWLIFFLRHGADGYLSVKNKVPCWWPKSISITIEWGRVTRRVVEWATHVVRKNWWNEFTQYFRAIGEENLLVLVTCRTLVPVMEGMTG